MGTLWSVLYSYCNWQLYKKKKKTTGVGGNGSHSSGSGTGCDFPPSFFVGLGREEINFCGSETGEVWEFTPESPSASNLCVCLTLLWNYHIKRDVLTWMQLWSRWVCFRENLFLRSFPMETKQFITTSYVGLQFKIHVKLNKQLVNTSTSYWT